jgi:hypothetical protein
LLFGRGVDAALDLEPMPIEVSETNAIANQSEIPWLLKPLPKNAGIVA